VAQSVGRCRQRCGRKYCTFAAAESAELAEPLHRRGTDDGVRSSLYKVVVEEG
jgi:hypothetical protein